MVLQKRLDYGFNGYQVPPTPRAARSIRRRCLVRTKADDHLMHGFDLLATVAGKLLSDGESSLSSVDISSGMEKPAVVKDHIVGTGEKDGDKPLEEKSCDQDCNERKFLITELVSEAPHSKFCSKEINCAQKDAVSRPQSGTTSDCSDKNVFAEQLVTENCKLQLGFFTPRINVESCGYRVSNCGSKDGRSKLMKIDSANSRNLSTNNSADICSLQYLEAWGRKPHRLVSSVDSVKFPFCQDCIPCGSFPVNQDNVNLVTRDDDDNSSRCTEPSTSNKPFRPPPRVGDCKFRKLRPSNHCKVIPNMKDDEHYNADTEKCNKHERTNSFKQLRSLRDYPFKKRKLYDCSLASKSRQGINGDRICSLPENGSNGGALSSSPMLPVTTILTSAAVEHGSFHSRNPQVKLKIKSFKVPELIIEIAETATVGSLKKTVMEAVNTVLGGGLCVGVLLQGKKIRDDNKTLMQTGISHDDKTDTLGFTLEPSPSQLPMQISQEDCLCPRKLLHFTPRPLASTARNAGQQQNLDPELYSPGSKLNNFMESENDSLPPPPDISSEKIVSESKVLVPAPAMKQESLAVIPSQKFKRCDSTQRRIRRPFTISEVEALVQAVEKLGTGRWRDVKLRAFNCAKYRTYVDLKDKWKTLVHTAQIYPQQRRGEPVPQELLDRVLTAHAYWSQQQARQQFKPQPDTCLLI